MKILCLILLVGIFAFDTEAWGPRIRWPRIRRIRIRIPKPNIGKIYDKASNAFKSVYNKVCGDRKKSDCGYSLVTRVQNVCNGQSCLKRNFNFGKRSIDFNDGRYSYMHAVIYTT